MSKHYILTEKKKAASEASVTDEELTTRSYTAEEVSANSPSSQQPTTPTTSLTTIEKMAEPSTMSTTEFSNTSKEAIKTGTTSPVEYHTQPSDKTFTDESVTKCTFPLVYDPKEEDCLDSKFQRNVDKMSKIKSFT